MTAIRPAIFPSSVIAAFSTRNGGVSDPPFGMNLSLSVGDRAESVLQNRRIFFQNLGIDVNALAIPRQMHSDHVNVIDRPGIYDDCDALVTTAANVFLVASFADCVPILVCAPRSGVVASVHAGWRGTVAGIVTKTVALLIERYQVDPGDILASIGPAADECCYEIGEDVAALFDSRFLVRQDGRVFPRLKEANRYQLMSMGVEPRHIEVSPYCTISHPELFHSHRRDGTKSGRMMGVIGLSIVD